MRYQHVMESPLGELRLFAEDDQLAGLYFEEHSPAPRNDTGIRDATPFAAIMDQLEEYFVGERGVFDVELCLDGTEFQQDVWSALRNIECGATKTYLEIANACGRASAVRAVGAAVGRNPISIVIPCHRVVGSNGSLTGFAGGLQRKQWLLNCERAQCHLL